MGIFTPAAVINFDTGNAAFDGGNGPGEAARILRNVAYRIEQGETDGVMRDINGNRVGDWSIVYPVDTGEES